MSPSTPGPFGELTVVVNPHAGRRHVGEEVPELERTLRTRGLPYRLLRMSIGFPQFGHGTSVASAAGLTRSISVSARARSPSNGS